MIALSLLTWSVSFASHAPAGSPVTSPLLEPDSSQVDDGNNTICTANWIYQKDGYTYLQHIVAKAQSGSTFIISTRSSDSCYLRCDNSFFIEFFRYDVESGNLISQSTRNSGYETGWGNYEPSTGYYNWSLFKRDGTAGGSYPVYYIAEGTNLYTSQGFVLSNPFVTWAIDAPAQNQYHSPLSEPAADQFNSYMVIDDHLIWVSYRVNGIYTRNSSIESTSELYSQSVQVSESGTGSYSGSSNGYTEDVSVPEGSFQGRETDYSRLFAGVYSGFDLGNIDFSSVNQGSVHFNSSGTVTFNDIEYFPVSFSQSDVLSLYRLYCIPTATDNFVFWLAPDRSLAQNTVVNMDFFFSEFDLDGNYIKSSFHSVTNTDLGLFDSYQSEEDISSIRCYGIDFYNLNNLPFNLSSVLWQYDLEFVQWRDSMLNMLQAIYQTLSQDPDVPEAATTANWGNEIKDAEPGTGISNDEVVSVYDNVDEINSSLSSSSEDLHRIIDMFSVGKLIGLVAFALSIGTAIIILGKKKSD